MLFYHDKRVYERPASKVRGCSGQSQELSQQPEVGCFDRMLAEQRQKVTPSRTFNDTQCNSSLRWFLDNGAGRT